MVDKFYTTNSNTDELYTDCKACVQLHLMYYHFELGLSKHSRQTYCPQAEVQMPSTFSKQGGNLS